jgi:hypothetical protein
MPSNISVTDEEVSRLSFLAKSWRGEQLRCPTSSMELLIWLMGTVSKSAMLDISWLPSRPADKEARLEDEAKDDCQDNTDATAMLPDTDRIDQPVETASIREDQNKMAVTDQDFSAPAPLAVSQLNTFTADVSQGGSLLTISNNSTQMQYTSNVPPQNIVSNPTSLATDCSSKYPVFHPNNHPPHWINTQLELHNHRLNMMETNLIQSCRISLLESKMNQSQQKANFQLELPEVAAYHAQPLPSVGDNLPLLCHCGLEPRLDTVLAPGPSLGKVFYRCIQRGVEQCSFFQFKQDDLAQVSFMNDWSQFDNYFIWTGDSTPKTGPFLQLWPEIFCQESSEEWSKLWQNLPSLP